MSDALRVHSLPIINSCLLTLDTLVVLAIYFAPKLVDAMRPELELRRSQGGLFSRPSGSIDNSSKAPSQASVSMALDPVREIEEGEDDDEDRLKGDMTNGKPHAKTSSTKMMYYDGNVSDNHP